MILPVAVTGSGEGGNERIAFSTSLSQMRANAAKVKTERDDTRMSLGGLDPQTEALAAPGYSAPGYARPGYTRAGYTRPGYTTGGGAVPTGGRWVQDAYGNVYWQP